MAFKAAGRTYSSGTGTIPKVDTLGIPYLHEGEEPGKDAKRPKTRMQLVFEFERQAWDNRSKSWAVYPSSGKPIMETVIVGSIVGSNMGVSTGEKDADGDSIRRPSVAGEVVQYIINGKRRWNSDYKRIDKAEPSSQTWQNATRAAGDYGPGAIVDICFAASVKGEGTIKRKVVTFEVLPPAGELSDEASDLVERLASQYDEVLAWRKANPNGSRSGGPSDDEGHPATTRNIPNVPNDEWGDEEPF